MIAPHSRASMYPQTKNIKDMSSFYTKHATTFVCNWGHIREPFAFIWILRKSSTTRCSLQLASSFRTLVLLTWSVSHFLKVLNIFTILQSYSNDLCVVRKIVSPMCSKLFHYTGVFYFWLSVVSVEMCPRLYTKLDFHTHKSLKTLSYSLVSESVCTKNEGSKSLAMATMALSV